MHATEALPNYLGPSQTQSWAAQLPDEILDAIMETFGPYRETGTQGHCATRAGEDMLVRLYPSLSSLVLFLTFLSHPRHPAVYDSYRSRTRWRGCLRAISCKPNIAHLIQHVAFRYDSGELNFGQLQMSTVGQVVRLLPRLRYLSCLVSVMTANDYAEIISSKGLHTAHFFSWTHPTTTTVSW
ncbi:hypothetical protein BC835DRAFT_190976 [Cytidiella melzeri]|nr:hypothetical protein BC835DRAFT_190976 [Cytidiella melzeri]